MKYLSVINIFQNSVKLILLPKHKKTVVFVEVKTRKTDNFGTPLESITKTKYNNIKTGVLSYATENKIKRFSD